MNIATVVAWLWMAAQGAPVERPLRSFVITEQCGGGRVCAPSKVSLIEIDSYAEINGKLYACPIGSHMTSDVIGGEGENTQWVTYCKVGEGK